MEANTGWPDVPNTTATIGWASALQYNPRDYGEGSIPRGPYLEYGGHPHGSPICAAPAPVAPAQVWSADRWFGVGFGCTVAHDEPHDEHEMMIRWRADAPDLEHVAARQANYDEVRAHRPSEVDGVAFGFAGRVYPDDDPSQVSQIRTGDSLFVPSTSAPAQTVYRVDGHSSCCMAPAPLALPLSSYAVIGCSLPPDHVLGPDEHGIFRDRDPHAITIRWRA